MAGLAFSALPPHVRVLFVGHTHEACSWVKTAASVLAVECPPKDFTLDPNARHIVNVGTVGYPRSTKKATYVLFDAEMHYVQLYSLLFDFADYPSMVNKSATSVSGRLSVMVQSF